MSFLDMFLNPAGYHLLAYGTLFGTQVHQTFMIGTTGYRVLNRQSFRDLQSALFPPYFALQSVAPLALAATYPGTAHVPASLFGVIAPENALTVLAPLTVMFVTGLVNATFVGPRTTQVMRERQRQEEKDGKKVTDPGPHSKEMQQLTARFGRLHGISTLLNLASMWASVFYAFGLAQRLL